MVRANQAPVDPSEELDLQAWRKEGGSTTSATFTAETPSGNLESDSFGYVETVLESLAVLGELGNALDVVAQRLPVEISSLLEGTIDEVHERAEFNKRMSILAPGSTGRPTSAFGSSRDLSLSGLRLASLESSVKPADQETLRDMFWTLYSKLDAVLQGLRVVYEVANRIGSVCCHLFFCQIYCNIATQRRDFKDSSGAKPGALFHLADLWTPLQTEVSYFGSSYEAGLQ